VARRGRRLRFWLAWWLALTGLWMLLVFKTDPAEVVAGVLAGALGATATSLVQAHEDLPVALRVRWLACLRRLPRAVVVETLWLAGLLARALVRREPLAGGFRTIEFPGARERSAHATGRRAFAKWFGSISPNAIVIGFAEDDDVVLVHQLVRTSEPPRVDPEPR
jgi:multisubunit Na+/H+ antiporter MnhE subunit